METFDFNLVAKGRFELGISQPQRKALSARHSAAIGKGSNYEIDFSQKR